MRRIEESAAPIVIGHRGACGYLPEHTLTSYFMAMEVGADFVEPDLVMTRDGVLVARHENEIGGTTDVASHREFADRRTTKRVDGVEISGWFTEDFTLRELKTLRARERIPGVRPDNARFDGRFSIPTFDEILTLLDGVQRQREARARQLGRPAPQRIGVYPETKHPTYFAQLGLAMEEKLVDALHRNGYRGPHAPAFIQCFEVSNLEAMRRMTELPIVQLLEADGAPYDFVVNGDKRTYQDLVRPAGLAQIATYANAIGPYKLMVVPRAADGTLGSPTTLIGDAHSQGLRVHAWTFRAENTYLPIDMRSCAKDASGAPGPSAAQALGDLQSELLAYMDAGLDGFFTDHPDLGVRARDAFLAD